MFVPVACSNPPRGINQGSDFRSFQNHDPRPEGRANHLRGQRPRVVHGVAVPFPSSHITRSGRLRLTANRPYDCSHKHVLHSSNRHKSYPKSAIANGRNGPFNKLTSSHDFCTGETISRIIVAPTKQSCWSKQSKAASSGGDQPLRSACRNLLPQV